MPTSLAELALRTGATLDGDGAVEVSRVATLEFAGPGAIAFLANPRCRAQLAATGASTVIVAPEIAAPAALPKLVGGNPYAIDATVIEDDVKLDNQIQVGHNCRIGAHTAIAGCVGIAGNTRIGRNCKIGGATMINGHIEICDDVVVSGGAGIHRSIIVPGTYTSVVVGAFPQAEWRHAQSLVQRLPEMQRRLRRLESGISGTPADAAGQGKGEQ